MNRDLSELTQKFASGRISRREFLRQTVLLSASLGAAQALWGRAPAPASAQEVVTLHWYNPHGSPSFQPHWQKLIADFEAANPDIKMSSDIVGWGDLFTKIQADATAGTLPDMTTIGLQFVLQYYEQGIAAETDAIVEQLKADGTEFLPAALKQAEVQGKHYALPRYIVFTGFTYRKDWFAEAGITLAGTPDKFQYTWDEFEATCKKLHAPPDRYAFACPWGTLDGGKHVWNLMMSNGAYILKEDGSLDWDNPAVKETYEFIIDMVQKYSPPGSAIYAMENVNTAFREGNLAMAGGDGDVHLELNENRPDWMGDKPGDHVAFMSFPYKTVAKAGMYGAAVGFVIFTGAHMPEVTKWCQFFFKDDNLIESIFPFRVLATPATLTAQQSKKFTEDPDVIAWKPVLDQMALAARENPLTAIANHWGASDMSSQIESAEVLQKVVQKVLAGDASLDDALADAKRQLEDMMEG
jgi:ABC-type glycerol-3-phosphate transport system substrate-binding protein